MQFEGSMENDFIPFNRLPKDIDNGINEVNQAIFDGIGSILPSVVAPAS
jgi:hypothetical protein